MKDDELELWKQQWQRRPDVVIDLIRRVEREAVQMRMGWLALVAPAAVATVVTVLVAMKPNVGGILFAAGLWLIMGIGVWLGKRSQKGLWAPAAETTAAYLELSIERCRRTQRGLRFWRLFPFFFAVTAFVLFGVYKGLKEKGALETTEDYWIVAATFLWTICVQGFVLYVLWRHGRKMQVELEYLLNLQRQLRASQQGEPN
jgi:hypothetical protein